MSLALFLLFLWSSTLYSSRRACWCSVWLWWETSTPVSCYL